MEQTKLTRASVSFGLSLAVTSVVNAVIVTVKEKSEAVMSGMKKITGHHWITHVLLVLATFFILAWIFGAIHGGKGTTIPPRRLIRTVVSGVLLATLIIAGFYLFAD